MIIKKGNLFEQQCDAICISTNGYFTYQQQAVMGRGVALQAAKKWPVLKKRLGYMLMMHGTHVYILSKKKTLGGEKIGYHVVSFPVKPKMGVSKGINVVKSLRDKFKKGASVPGWAMRANTKIIKRSAQELLELADARGWKKVVLPKVGCGAGELPWARVEVILGKILKGNRFIVVDYE